MPSILGQIWFYIPIVTGRQDYCLFIQSYSHLIDSFQIIFFSIILLSYSLKSTHITDNTSGREKISAHNKEKDTTKGRDKFPTVS